MIRENNEASYMSGNPNAPFMDHNMMSDLTQEEKELATGYLPVPREAEDIPEDEKRRLAKLKDKRISWGQDLMGPVRDQA